MKKLIQLLRARRAVAFARRRVEFCNIGEGVYAGGLISLKADAAIADRYLIGKAGSDVNHVAVCGVSDTPLCVITDEAEAAEDPVACEFLGAQCRTTKMVANGVIGVNELLTPAASGQVRKISGLAAGTYWCVGRNRTASGAAADELEVIASFPHQITVV